jgi:hypothetical protein
MNSPATSGKLVPLPSPFCGESNKKGHKNKPFHGSAVKRTKNKRECKKSKTKNNSKPPQKTKLACPASMKKGKGRKKNCQRRENRKRKPNRTKKEPKNHHQKTSKKTPSTSPEKQNR